MMKHSAGAIRGIQSHNNREKPSHSNPDIDYELSGCNYDIVSTEGYTGYQAKIKDIVETGRIDKSKAVRKDAVLLCEFIISASPEFFRENTGYSINRKDYFKDAYMFFARRYGFENVVHATVHMDETTPHMHFGLVPITDDGRLSAKSLFTKRELTELQGDFAREVGEKYGLERGIEGSENEHEKASRAQAELNRLEAEIGQAEVKLEEITVKHAELALKCTEEENRVDNLAYIKNVLEDEINANKRIIAKDEDFSVAGWEAKFKDIEQKQINDWTLNGLPPEYRERKAVEFKQSRAHQPSQRPKRNDQER